MKFVYTSFALCAVALMSTAALADNHEEKVTHYEAATLTDSASALSTLKTQTDAIGAILVNATLDSNQLEKIHEISYTLEAAVDKLSETAKNDTQETTVKTADDAVQAIHHASEDHEASIVRQSFASLKASVDMVEAAFAPETATPSAIQN